MDDLQAESSTIERREVFDVGTAKWRDRSPDGPTSSANARAACIFAPSADQNNMIAQVHGFGLVMIWTGLVLLIPAFIWFCIAADKAAKFAPRTGWGLCARCGHNSWRSVRPLNGILAFGLLANKSMLQCRFCGNRAYKKVMKVTIPRVPSPTNPKEPSALAGRLVLAAAVAGVGLVITTISTSHASHSASTRHSGPSPATRSAVTAWYKATGSRDITNLNNALDALNAIYPPTADNGKMTAACAAFGGALTTAQADPAVPSPVLNKDWQVSLWDDVLGVRACVAGNYALSSTDFEAAPIGRFAAGLSADDPASANGN